MTTKIKTNSTFLEVFCTQDRNIYVFNQNEFPDWNYNDEEIIVCYPMYNNKPDFSKMISIKAKYLAKFL